MESKFTGGVLELIGMSIACSFLCSITLGLATPWAICMMIKWVFKNTSIDGKTLTFDGNGAQLIGTWIKWILLSCITLGIYSHWIPTKLIGWVVSHVHVA